MLALKYVTLNGPRSFTGWWWWWGVGVGLGVGLEAEIQNSIREPAKYYLADFFLNRIGGYPPHSPSQRKIILPKKALQNWGVPAPPLY